MQNGSQLSGSTVPEFYLDYLNVLEDEEGERMLQRRNDFENMSEEQFLERYIDCSGKSSF